MALKKYKLRDEILTMTFAGALRSMIWSKSPFDFFDQLSNFQRHFRQAGSEISTFFNDRAERKKRNRSFVQPKTAPSLICLPHPAHLILLALGIFTYLTANVGIYWLYFDSKLSLYRQANILPNDIIKMYSRYITLLSTKNKQSSISKRDIF
jgi:hypothetical protein